jgi:hypothetical protein
MLIFACIQSTKADTRKKLRKRAVQNSALTFLDKDMLVLDCFFTTYYFFTPHY